MYQVFEITAAPQPHPEWLKNAIMSRRIKVKGSSVTAQRQYIMGKETAGVGDCIVNDNGSIKFSKK